MGVHGLWELLAPVGRRVSVETLAGKKLAIDASIWLVQFMKAMRDDKGEMVRNAHLIGFFRRICKLLFLRTKPVFVFDGATPALKRRTVIARRRQRENAQAKIRKTAEKLLLNHMKSMRLKELANDIENKKIMNDVKGKKVVSDHSEVSAKNEGNESDESRKHDQQKLDEMLAASIAAEEDERLTNVASTSNAIPSDEDGGIEEMIFPENLKDVDDALLNALPPDLLAKMRKRSGTRDGTNHEKLDISKKTAQEQLDAMLAASIAAEEDGYITNNATAPSAEVLSDEEDGDDEMIVPEEMQGAIDRAVLDSLPLSMRLDLFAQMKERQMAENRQNYQKVKKAPEKFSELQIQSYLKSVALRREINQVQKAASGIGVDGLQTSRIASEANKKFIFSSAFTGDKEKLASSRDDRNKDGETSKTSKHVSSEFCSGLPSTSKSDRTSELIVSNSKSKFNFEDEVETFLDDQGRVRVSRVRAMGIRMTRDLQRNLELMKEIDKDLTPASNIESLFTSVVEKGGNEKLAESSGDAKSEMVQMDEKEEQGLGESRAASLQISFDDDGDNKSLDRDDEIFARLVTETSIKLSSPPEKDTSIVEISDSDWEEGIVDCVPKDQKAEAKAANEEDLNADSEVEWEDGISDSEYAKFISKGTLEEDAELQEAIRRSLEEQKIHVAPHENVNVKEQTEVQNSHIQTIAPASENITVDQNASFPNITEQISGFSHCSSKVNCQEGMGFSKMTDSLKEQESDSIGLQRMADESFQLVQGSHSERSSQGKDMPKNELTQHLESDEAHFTTEEQRDISAENYQISASAESHVKGSSYASDMSGKIDSVDKTQNAKLVSSSMTVSSNDFDMEQTETDKEDFTELRTFEAYDLEAIKSNLDEEMRKLDQECMDLGNEQKKHERNAESVSSEMFTECQELLQMFGLPYIIAPMEAEAQCAHLELANLVDGVVTDDSDVLLFGAQSVYKNIFDDRKYVETYFMKDIEKEFGLTREKLIHMALLLGSDYTEGISGIGIVNAIEVLNAFPEDDGLEKFREWIESPDPSILGKSSKRAMKKGSGDPNHLEDLKQNFMETHRNVSKNWHIPPNFPSEVVVSAYSTPQVDKSAEPFSWGKPDIFLLRKLCWERFGWSGQKADELLVPVLNEYNKRETQLRMEAFYSFNEKFAKIRSRRIKKAVKGITGAQPSEPKDESNRGAATKTTRKRRATACESAESKERPSGEEKTFGQNESSTTEILRTDKSKKKKAKGKSKLNDSGASKRARVGKTAKNGKEAAVLDTDVADESNSDDNDLLEIPVETFNGRQEVRRSGRSRKAVDYNMGDSDNDSTSKSKSSLHVSEKYHATDGDAAPEDCKAAGFHADEASDPDYLKAGGGFCMEDEQSTGLNRDGAAERVEDTYDLGNGLASHSIFTQDMALGDDDKDENPCHAPPGALTPMPFLRRKRKKT